MPNLTQADIYGAARYALRHYVPFSYYARSPEIFASNNGMAATCICSAFIMSVRSLWWLVTAGHILDEMQRERDKGITQVSFRLWDGWGPGAQHRNYIPFIFEEKRAIKVYQDGLDYGLIPLHKNAVANLSVNGVVPIGEEHYETDWPDEFDAYAMIGTPSKSVSVERVGELSTMLTQSACVIQLEPEANPPSELVKPFPRFYGRITTPEDSEQWLAISKDIDGMSGGPVIGIRRDDNGVRYWVVGVQSGWIPSSRIIAANYFQNFARIVNDAVIKAVTQLGE